MSQSPRDDLVVLGRIGSVYGIKGWVKVFSDTEPKEGILDYPQWWVRLGDQDWRSVKVLSGKPHGKALVAHLDGCSDRNIAQSYCGAEVAVNKCQLPGLEEGDYYWHQLEGLNVVTDVDLKSVLLGRVDHVMATGANDVLVVHAVEGSVDDRERLLPYLVDRVIKNIDLEAGEILVDWDPEYW